MKKVYIIHGWGGSPEEPMLKWLADELKKGGFEVVAPAMPNTDEPKIETWVPFLENVVGIPDENTFFVGHSIGCQAILRFLETLPEETKIGGAIFVAGWFNLTNQSEEEKIIAKPWTETPIDYAKMKANLFHSVAVLSDNDPYVPYEETKKDFETKLGSEVITIHEAGHFTSDDGFITFPQLVEIFESRFK